MKQELESKAAATIEMAMEYAVVELLVGELEKSNMRMRMRMLLMMMTTMTMIMMIMIMMMMMMMMMRTGFEAIDEVAWLVRVAPTASTTRRNAKGQLAVAHPKDALTPGSKLNQRLVFFQVLP